MPKRRDPTCESSFRDSDFARFRTVPGFDPGVIKRSRARGSDFARRLSRGNPSRHALSAELFAVRCATAAGFLDEACSLHKGASHCQHIGLPTRLRLRGSLRC